jgi:AAHS family 3-hydroxyphenylpropionic acid transporter
MAPALKLSKAAIGYAGAVANLGLIVGALIGGALADRWGRRPVLVAATVWFGAFSLATAMAQDAQSLLAVRFAAGVGFGGAMPNLVAIASDISRGGQRAATVSAMFVGMPIGGGCSALLTGAAPDLDWRTIFVVGGALPLLVAPAAFWLLPETRPARGPAETSGRHPLATLFADGRAPATLLMWLAFAVTLFVHYVILTWLPSLVIAKHLPKAVGAAAALAFNLGGAAGGLGLSRVVDRFGYRWPMPIAYLVAAAGLGGLAIAARGDVTIALAALIGVALQGALFSLYALPPTAYPARMRGFGAGAAVGAGRAGSVAGPAVAGVLLSAGGFTGVVAALAPMLGVAAVAAVLFTFVRPAEQD